MLLGIFHGKCHGAELEMCPMLEMKDKVRFREGIWWIYMAPAADHFVLNHVVKLTLDSSECSVSSK